MMHTAEAPSVLEPARDRQPQSYANRAYAALVLGLVFYVFAIWYEVFRDTRKDALSCRDPLFQSHRQWRLRTSFLYLVWSILAGFCVPFGLGGLVFIPVWGWYAYRVVRGFTQFARGRMI